jgi:hypothetical protein
MGTRARGVSGRAGYVFPESSGSLTWPDVENQTRIAVELYRHDPASGESAAFPSSWSSITYVYLKLRAARLYVAVIRGDEVASEARWNGQFYWPS